MLKIILKFNDTISELFQEGASLDALMEKFRSPIAEINNFKYYEDKEFDEKLKFVEDFFDNVKISDLEESATA